MNIDKKISSIIEDIILWSRYLLAPLVLALLFRIVNIITDIYLVLMNRATEAMLGEHTISVLHLLDLMMIANLIWFICAGSFYVFIDKNETGKRRPRGLIHISFGVLKEKLAGSLIGITSVLLLQEFLHIGLGINPVEWGKLGALLAIHCVFILGLLVFSKVNAAPHHDHTEEKAKKEEVTHEEPEPATA